MTETMITRRTNGDIEEYDGGAEQPQAMVAVSSSRVAAEIQASMTMAKRFPRDQLGAWNRIMQSCRRRKLAEVAQYEYPRGGQMVTGPSIKLARALALNWGNMESGIVEIDRRDGESTAMAFAWDLETNTRRSVMFTVRHWRDTKKGGHALKDERDIYELIANMGARRERACILSIIPSDIIDASVEEIEKTLANANAQEPLIDRIRKMMVAFSEMQVSQAMIEKMLGHNAEVISERELIRLRKIYQSIRDGMSKREDHFDANAGEESEVSRRVNQQARAQPAEGERPDPPPASEPDSQVDEEREKWDAFVADCREASKERGHTSAYFDKMWKKEILSAAVIGKEHEYPQDKRGELYQRIVNGVGHWAPAK